MTGQAGARPRVERTGQDRQRLVPERRGEYRKGRGWSQRGEDRTGQAGAGPREERTGQDRQGLVPERRGQDRT